MTSKYSFIVLSLILAGATALVTGAQESQADRIARIAAMSPAEKAELARRQKRFEELPAAERERVKQLQQDLAVRPDADELVDIMTRYNEWLKTLSANQLADLRQMP